MNIDLIVRMSGSSLTKGKYKGCDHMKVFTEEFENKLVSFIGTAVVVSIALLFFGIAGGIELGLIF